MSAQLVICEFAVFTVSLFLPMPRVTRGALHGNLKSIETRMFKQDWTQLTLKKNSPCCENLASIINKQL